MDWIEGDLAGMKMPTHPEALRAAGPEFLTAAFRRFGALGADNAVRRITRLDDCPRGSTGRKVFLSVEYARSDPGLHSDLFVKFSRAFDDPLRDNQRFEMEDEARFAAVSAGPGFPIAIPACYFSDFHHASGTGMIVTQLIPYGQGSNEPHYEKCLDWQMPDPLDHYRVIVATNGRLAAAHRAGQLPPAIDRFFPFDSAAAIAADRIRYDERQLRNRIARYADFSSTYPQLLPANIHDSRFIEALMHDIPRLLMHEQAIRTWLFSRPASIVFAHWNANVDNAWFWRDDTGQRRCGFIDWGRVGRMSVAQALWGTLSGAETGIWDNHLEELVGIFAANFADLPPESRLDPAEIRLEIDMLASLLGTCWLLDAVPLILRDVPDLASVESRRDPRIRDNERARTQLHMLTVYMNLLQTRDIAGGIDRVLAQTGAQA